MILAALTAAFPVEFQKPEATARIWAAALADVSYEAAELAAVEWVRVGKKFPAAAEIRELAAELVSPKADPDLAWALVLREARRVGAAGTPELAPEIADAVASCGGWRIVCLADLEKSDIRSRFVFAYRAVLQRARRYEDLTGLAIGAGQARKAIGNG